MKVILQDFEPQTRVAATATSVPVPVRKPRLRLNPVNTDIRLFHAL